MTKVTGAEAKRLGLLAEAAFKTLCHEAALTVNSSHEADENGWDCVVEIPIDGRSGPTSFSPSTLTTFVQVKGTRRKTLRSWPIALSNWQKHLSMPLPVYCCIILINDTDKPQAAHLVLLGEGIIEPVLEVLLGNTDDNRPLHKQSRAISWGPAHQLARVDGPSLKAKMLAQVGSDPAQYHVRKKQLLEHAGFGPEPFAVSFTREVGSPEEAYRDMVDWDLGLRPDLNLDSIVVTKRRFSWVEEIQRSGLATAMFMNQQPVSRAPLVLFDDSGRSLELQSELYIPNLLMGHIPPEHIRYRIEAWPLRIILAESNTTIRREGGQWLFRGHGEVDLKTPPGIARLKQWAFWRRARELLFSEARISFPAVREEPPLVATVRLSQDVNQDRPLCRAIKSLELLATFANVDLQEGVSAASLISQEERIHMAALLHSGGVFSKPLSVGNPDPDALERYQTARQRGGRSPVRISLIIPVHLSSCSIYTFGWLQTFDVDAKVVENPDAGVLWTTRGAQCLPCQFKIIDHGDDLEAALNDICDHFEAQVTTISSEFIILRAERHFEDCWNWKTDQPAPDPNALPKPSTTSSPTPR